LADTIPRLRRTLALLAVASFTACGPPAPIRSVAQFGAATDSLADSIEVTSRGGTEICEKKRLLEIDERTVLGEYSVKQALEALNEDTCKRFRDTAAFYDALARQLGAFGSAMKTLADGGNTDYTADLTELSSVVVDVGISIDPTKVDAAKSLAGKLLSWYAQGYSTKKISIVLEESRADVAATLALLDVVLQAYDAQVSGYSAVIRTISEDKDFEQGANDVVKNSRKVAQAELVRTHAGIASDRRVLLSAAHAALGAVSTVHEQLVAEAQRKREEYDVPALLARARELHRDVLAFRSIATESSN
jgi:hypothetical protein